jgi:hypothetical protein
MFMSILLASTSRRLRSCSWSLCRSLSVLSEPELWDPGEMLPSPGDDLNSSTLWAAIGCCWCSATAFLHTKQTTIEPVQFRGRCALLTSPSPARPPLPSPSSSRSPPSTSPSPLAASAVSSARDSPVAASPCRPSLSPCSGTP